MQSRKWRACNTFTYANSVYLVHEESKDKQFELEISWAKHEGHTSVPKEVLVAAESFAKASLDVDMDE